MQPCFYFQIYLYGCRELLHITVFIFTASFQLSEKEFHDPFYLEATLFVQVFSSMRRAGNGVCSFWKMPSFSEIDVAITCIAFSSARSSWLLAELVPETEFPAPATRRVS